MDFGPDDKRSETDKRYGRTYGVTKPGHCGHGYKMGSCPQCDPVHPTVERTPDSPTTDSIERHPSYAHIQANRCSGRVYLYGSEFDHQHFISVTIKASELHRNLSNDRTLAGEEYIEVWLSESQWANFVSSMNSGDGPQCTLKRLQGKRVSDLPVPVPRTQLFKDEVKARLTSATAALTELKRRLSENVSGKKENLSLVETALREMGPNAGFVADQFDEHVEETIHMAKAEVDAYVQNAINRHGLAALQAGAPLALGGWEKGP